MWFSSFKSATDFNPAPSHIKFCLQEPRAVFRGERFCARANKFHNYCSRQFLSALTYFNGSDLATVDGQSQYTHQGARPATIGDVLDVGILRGIGYEVRMHGYMRTSEWARQCNRVSHKVMKRAAHGSRSELGPGSGTVSWSGCELR